LTANPRLNCNFAVSAALGNPSTSDLQVAWSAGARAVREGRPADALAAFQDLVDAGLATAPVWIGVAMARRDLGDAAAELAALQQALALEARNLHALIQTADHHARAGDARAASAYYDAVVKVARSADAIEPKLMAEIARSQRMHAHYAALYEAHLRQALDRPEIDTPAGRRARRALDLLLGKSELYPQQPRGFFFPELPTIEYAERAAFPWLGAVEAATGDIRAELMRVLEEDSAFEPYIQAESDRPFFDDHGMLGNPNWSAFYLWKGGEPVAENAARCPAAMKALEQAPLCRIPGRTPSILFSLLRPGAHILPHHGFTNARYICHLPLIVPEGCAMRVGATTRPWTEGKACVFDDSIEHEAWNRNPDRLRVVMIFDIWRPELTGVERDLVASILQAVDTFGADPDD
jgi:aspartyl/asparaginyl beta-hydroxylase (cupin superfamily)